MKTFLGILSKIFFLIIIFLPPIYAQAFQQMIRFPFQDSAKINYCQSQPLVHSNEILIFYSANNSPQDTIFVSRSSDNGQNWSMPVFVTNLDRAADEMLFLSGTISRTGRILIVFTIGEIPIINNTKFIYSDNDGLTWSVPQNVIGVAYIPYPKINETTDGKLWIVGRNNYFFYSNDNGNTWLSKNLGFSTSMTTSFDLISIDSTNYFMTYDKYDSNNDKYKIISRKSLNSGESWSDETIITELDRSEKGPAYFKNQTE